LNVREFLEGGWGRFYRVPEARAEEFIELHRRAEPTYQLHATGWHLRRSRLNPEDWRETGPTFRERADLEAATEALDAQPGLVESIAAFQLDRPIGVDPTASMWSTIEEASDFDTIFLMGDPRGGFGAPKHRPIDPERMTDAMRLAHALARELAKRLDAAVPEGYSVTATNETITIAGERPITWLSLVDIDILEAVEAVLELVQDELAEHTAVPWPHDPSRGYKFHEPQAQIEDGAVRLWYGPRRNPVLEFEAIPMSLLTG
jgi:hypothetical protein